MSDFERQADRAATAFIVETGVRTPVENYETLHAIVAGAYLTGLQDGLRTARDVVKEAHDEVA